MSNFEVTRSAMNLTLILKINIPMVRTFTRKTYETGIRTKIQIFLLKFFTGTLAFSRVSFSHSQIPRHFSGISRAFFDFHVQYFKNLKIFTKTKEIFYP